MSQERDEYIKALFHVSKNTPPDVWLSFMAAFRNYVEYDMERLIVSVPTNEALVSIGMCRRMREIRDDFSNIELLFKKIKGE